MSYMSIGYCDTDTAIGLPPGTELEFMDDAAWSYRQKHVVDDVDWGYIVSDMGERYVGICKVAGKPFVGDIPDGGSGCYIQVELSDGIVEFMHSHMFKNPNIHKVQT